MMMEISVENAVDKYRGIRTLIFEKVFTAVAKERQNMVLPLSCGVDDFAPGASCVDAEHLDMDEIVKGYDTNIACLWESYNALDSPIGDLMVSSIQWTSSSGREICAPMRDILPYEVFGEIFRDWVRVLHVLQYYAISKVTFEVFFKAVLVIMGEKLTAWYDDDAIEPVSH